MPSPPRSVTATTTGTVSFLPPSNNGGTPITGYTMEVVCTSCGDSYGDDGNQIVHCTASPCQASLTPGEEYQIYVTGGHGWLPFLLLRGGRSQRLLGGLSEPGRLFHHKRHNAPLLSLQPKMRSDPRCLPPLASSRSRRWVPCNCAVLPQGAQLKAATLPQHHIPPPILPRLQNPPGTPRNLAVSATGLLTYDYPSTDGGATVNDGGAHITSYTITVKQGSTTVKTYTTSDPNLLSQQLSGLTPGTAYSISVTANNIAGSSSPATMTYTPAPVSQLGQRLRAGRDGVSGARARGRQCAGRRAGCVLSACITCCWSLHRGWRTLHSITKAIHSNKSHSFRHVLANLFADRPRASAQRPEHQHQWWGVLRCAYLQWRLPNHRLHCGSSE